ncbi:hypothetical protein BGZ54_008528 [Gamsiella multidivaricata]|nr:hypothetical protein BGZ54_008528 [Gamsiella multidivaricata]
MEGILRKRSRSVHWVRMVVCYSLDLAGNLVALFEVDMVVQTTAKHTKARLEFRNLLGVRQEGSKLRGKFV